MILKKRRLGRLAAVFAMTGILAGCVQPVGNTTHPRPAAQQTAMQKAIGRCVFSVGAGAVLGALIDDGDGALKGAALGLGACGILIQVAAAEDRARIAAAEREALQANAARTTSFATTDGKKATVRTEVQAAPVPRPAVTPTRPTKVAEVEEPTFTACRYATQTISVEGEATTAPRQLWCRVPAGDWQPVDA